MVDFRETPNTTNVSFVIPSTHDITRTIVSATGRVVIVAPFIKSSALVKFLSLLPDSIDELTCVSRWQPQDIATGVCDLQILDDITARGGKLLVFPRLHAKYFRLGNCCLVGSANLTGRGFGWRSPANLELLVQIPDSFPGLELWEKQLLNSGVEVTEELREHVRTEAEKVNATGVLADYDNSILTMEEVDDTLWIPTCPVPDRLWSIYQGHGLNTMVSSARTAAQQDLEALDPPKGLNEALFNAFIAGILRQMPLMSEIDHLASMGLTDNQAEKFLKDKQKPKRTQSTTQAWRTIKSWLIHFYPATYRLETDQEVLVKGRSL